MANKMVKGFKVFNPDWTCTPENQKQIILSLPNFDKEKFYQCTGIRVDGDIDA